MQQFLGEAIKIQIGDVLMCKRESFVCVIILLKNQFPWFCYYFVFFVAEDIYTVKHKKGGSTFIIITLENLDGF